MEFPGSKAVSGETREELASLIWLERQSLGHSMSNFLGSNQPKPVKTKMISDEIHIPESSSETPVKGKSTLLMRIFLK
jgi:hypothetical protein